MHPRELRCIEWRGDADGALALLDQRVLPEKETCLELRTVGDAARAIREMVVRGAPAIGISASYALVLAAADCRLI